MTKLNALIFDQLRKKFLSHFGGTWALNGLDKELAKYLSYRSGTFVEAGANDGITQSNTYFFEKYWGWSGLLIEPIPELAKQCKINRPDAIVENCALVSKDFGQDKVVMQYCNLMSFVKNGIGNDLEEERYIDLALEHLPETQKPYSVEVPAQTLSEILRKNALLRFDFLSLDVEGYEYEVLNGIDFNEIVPHIMLIEVRKRSLIDELLNEWYEPISVLTVNQMYSDVLYARRN